MNSVKIQNIKGVKELTFEIPTAAGVYLLTGLNGCGKTTLLVALDRIGNPNAFANYLRVGGSTGLDAVRNGHFIYTIGAETVSYNHKEKRWSPQPRTKSKMLIDSHLFADVIYMGTEGARAYMQEPKDIDALRPNYQGVSQEFIDTINSVLDTHHFDNLKYIQIDMRGRRVIPHRENKLYSVLTPGKPTFTERNFSLGERFIINMLDIIERVPDDSLLLIDEIELALHPSAQVRFYDYLKTKAATKNLVVIISTHSSSLIRHSANTFYLENNQGFVSVLDDCYPAYILKDMSPWEDRKPDYMFFVEDVQARYYLREVIKIYQTRENNNADICVLPVAGKKQTVQYMLNNNGVGTNTLNNMHCFPDADVYTELQQLLLRYANLSQSEKEYTDMMTANAAHITYLDITPELGMWNQLHDDCSYLEPVLVDRNGGVALPQPLSTIIAQVDIEEAGNNVGKPRRKAKFDMKNFIGKIQAIIPITEDEFWRIAWKAYAELKMLDPAFYNLRKAELDAIL